MAAGGGALQLKEYWYIAARAAALRSRPLARTVLGERLVLFVETHADRLSPAGAEDVAQAVRHALYGDAPGIPSMPVCLLGTVLFAALTFALGTFVVTRRRARDAN